MAGRLDLDQKWDHDPPSMWWPGETVELLWDAELDGAILSDEGARTVEREAAEHR